MKSIYVVMGESGEYSDWTTWPVVAVDDETEAQGIAAGLQNSVQYFLAELERNDIYVSDITYAWEPQHLKLAEIVKQIDAALPEKLRNDGVRYRVEKVEYKGGSHE